MNENIEYLLLYSREKRLFCVSSADIWYIEADADYSYIYLIDKGDAIKVSKQLHVMEGIINKWFPSNCKYYYRVGRSLIINVKHLDYISTEDKKIYLSDRSSEVYLDGYKRGYKDGYDTGYSDGKSGKRPSVPSALHPATREIKVSEKALSEFRKKIEVRVNEKMENNTIEKVK